MTTWTRQRIAAATGTAGLILAISRDDIGAGWWWVVPLVVATTWVLVGAIPAAHAALPPGLLPGLLLGSLAAMFACVPETNHVGWIAIAPATLAAIELRRGRRVSSVWLLGVAHLVWWAGVYGATGRESALVGAWFAWWPTFVAAAMSPWVGRLRSPHWLTATVVMTPLVVATVLVARTGALEPTVDPALAAVGIAAPASTALAALVLIVLFDRAGARGRFSGRGDQRGARRRPTLR